MSKETDGLDELLCWNVKRAEVAEEQVTQLKQENQQLKEQLKNELNKLKTAIRFSTPEIHRFAVVRYVWQEKKPYKIVKCYDCYIENNKIVHCFYGINNTNFKVIDYFATEQEAEMELKELKNE